MNVFIKYKNITYFFVIFFICLLSFFYNNHTEASSVNISVVNFTPKNGDKDYNINEMTKYITLANEAKANIIIFPENSTIGEINPQNLAETTSDKTAKYFSTLAQKYDMYIIYGAPEVKINDASHIYNSAFICTPDGKINSYQQILPTTSIYTPGNDLKIVDTKWGKIGLSIDNDIFHASEQGRIYSSNNCFLIANLSSIKNNNYIDKYDFKSNIDNDYSKLYINKNSLDYYTNSAENVALLNGLFFANANTNGNSLIVGPSDIKTNIDWKNYINQNKDFKKYIIKNYTSYKSLDDNILTATINTELATNELTHLNIFQPNLYEKWFHSLTTKKSSLYNKMQDTLTVAVAQITPKWGNKEENTKSIIKYIKQAADKKVDIIVFPEMALTDYAATSTLNSPEWQMVCKEAESVDGIYAKQIAEAAKKYNMYVIYGTPEINPTDSLHPYNSAFVSTPQGETLSYKKIHPVEGDWATSGYEPLIIDSPWGKIGVSICMDTYAYPELARYYAASGCRILVNPTASGSYAGENFFYNSALSNIALRENMLILSSDLVGYSGINKTSVYPGKSTIITNNGVSPIYLTPLSMSEEKLYTAKVNLKNLGLSIKNYNPNIYAKGYLELTHNN